MCYPCSHCGKCKVRLDVNKCPFCGAEVNAVRMHFECPECGRLLPKPPGFVAEADMTNETIAAR